MTDILLSLHVLAVIITIGPVTIAASMVPAIARRASAGPDAARETAVLTTLHRICRVYTAAAVAVPVAGFAVAGSQHVLGDTWLLVSIGLTVIAAAVLALLVLPQQASLLAGLDQVAQPEAAPTDAASSNSPGTTVLATRAKAGRLAMTTGVFNLLWVAVTVLMVVHPGSSAAG